MTRQEFLDTLERELAVLPRDERTSALRYYNDYFDDAGDDERAVIAELGTPQMLAADIVREYKPRAAVEDAVPPPPQIDALADDDAQTDSTPADDAQPNDAATAPEADAATPDNEIPVNIVRPNTPPYGGAQTDSAQADAAQTGAAPHDSAQTGDPGFRPNNMRRPNYSAGMIIAIVCTAPLWFPLLIALLGCVFAFAMTLIALLFSLAVCGVAVLIAGGAFLAAGILELSVAVPSGILAIGVGLATAGIGLLLIALMINVLARAVPAIFRGIGQLISSISGKLRRSPNA